MSDDNNDGKFSISRRKALAGLGGIGAATALGGFGTWAQFTDEESETVTFTAGGIDGTVMGRASYNGQDVSTFDDEFETQEVENVGYQESGALGLGISFDDVKPGDFGCFAFKITVENNPAWVAACLGVDNDIDGRAFEPELEAANETNHAALANDGEGGFAAQTSYSSPGELAENTLVIPFYKGATAPTQDRWDPCVFFDEENEEFNTEAYQGSGAVGTATEFWDNSENSLYPQYLTDAVGYEMVDTQSWGDSGQNVQTHDFGNSIAVGPGCVFLNGDGPTNDNQQGAAPLQPGNEIWMGWDWHVPFDVGNEAQGDSFDLQLGFVFGQTRHTENAQLSNIYAPGQNLP